MSPRRKTRTAPALWQLPIREFSTYLRAAGRREGSLVIYRGWLERLGQTHPDPWLVTGPDLIDWMAGQRLMPETRKSGRTALRSFYSWAVTFGRISESPAAALPPVRVPASVPRPVTEQMLLSAIEAADDRTRLMVCLAAYAGLRVCEVAAVHPKDILEGRLFVTGKGGDGRVVPVHPILQREIDAELERRRAGSWGTGYRYTANITAGGWLFPSPAYPGEHVTAYCVRACIGAVLPAGWSSHKLRHRFATRALVATKDLRAVQTLLGHTSPATTARYTLVTDAALSAAVMAL